MGNGLEDSRSGHIGKLNQSSRRLTSPGYARAQGKSETYTPRIDWAPAYLNALEASRGQKKKAAEAAHVTLRSVQRRRLTDSSFLANERERMSIVKDVVESEITRRAIEGVTRKQYDRNGRLISEEIEYSDNLLLRLAERLETGTWCRQRKIEHAGKISFPTRADRKKALAEARIAMRSDPETGEPLPSRLN